MIEDLNTYLLYTCTYVFASYHLLFAPTEGKTSNAQNSSVIEHILFQCLTQWLFSSYQPCIIYISLRHDMQQLLTRHGKPQLDPEMQELQRRVEDRALIRRSSSAHRVWTCKKNNSRKLRWRWEMFWLEEIGLQTHHVFHVKADFGSLLKFWKLSRLHPSWFGCRFYDFSRFYLLALLGGGSP